MNKMSGFILMCALALSGYGQIVSNYWVATGAGGNWDTPANWSRGTVPDTNTVAILTNVVSGRYAVEVDGADCKAWRVICGGLGSKDGMELNIRTKLSAVNRVNGGGEDYGFRVDGYAWVNIYSNATLDSYQKLISLWDGTSGISNMYYVAKGGTLVVASFATGKSDSFVSGFRIEGRISSYRNSIIGGSYGANVFDGGSVLANVLTCAGNGVYKTVFTNDCEIFVSPLSFAGGSHTAIYGGLITTNGIITTAPSYIGGPAGGNASTTVNMYGGTWFLLNPLWVCVRPQGLFNIIGSDAKFLSGTNVYVGATTTGGSGFMAGYHGYINVSNGLFRASNAAGQATLWVGNITGGFFTSAGGTSEVDNVVISCPPSNGIGRLTINGGTFTAGTSFTATNGTNSAVWLQKGRLSMAKARISNGGVFSVGNGINSAELGLLAGPHSFANGLVVSNAASLLIKESSQLTGNIEFKTGAGLGGHIRNGQLGTLRVIGTVTVPSVLSGVLVSADGSKIQTGVLVEADSISGETSVGRITAGDSEYLVYQDGNFIRVNLVPKATLLRLY